MLRIVITEKGGDPRRFEFDKDEITIGRVEENDICLPKGNVSKKHARMVAKDGAVVLIDLKSTNGTFLDGERVSAPQVVSRESQISIGDFGLNVELQEEQHPAAAVVEEESIPTPPPVEPARPPRAATNTTQAPLPRGTAPINPKNGAPNNGGPTLAPAMERYGALLKSVHDQLIEKLDLRRLDVDALGSDELHQKTTATVRSIVQSLDAAGDLLDVSVETLIEDVVNEALGLGPLEQYLKDDDISEIMVNNAHQIFVERKGRLERADKLFSSNQTVLNVIERIVAPLGRRIDESSPLVDARLKDGSRVNAIIPPLALKGPSITIRKFSRERLGIKDLVRFGTLTEPMAEFLDACVKARKNIVISGGTGSGKTTLLNVIASFIPDHERIVTIEDAAELQLPQEDVVSLESRPANIEGTGLVSIRDLVRNSLRMRPDRIVVGECRGGEALDMLQAMNTGHDGSLTTLHANTPRDALARLETMVLMSGMELPMRAIREQIASAVDIILQQTRFSDGSRRVTHISEVTGMETEVITLQDIFNFKQEGFDANARVQGRYVATGFVPKFYDDLQKRGLAVNMEIFREG